MVNHFSSYAGTQPTAKSLPITLIRLKPKHVQQAEQVLNRLEPQTEAERWQIHRNLLATYAFQKWAQQTLSGDLDQSPPTIDLDHCTIFQMPYASVLDAVCNINLGDFRVCVLSSPLMMEHFVSVPYAALKLEEFAAHLYIFTELLEETGEVIVRGYLRHDQISAQIEALELTPEPDWTYSIPTEWINPDLTHLLPTLKYLQPATVLLPHTLKSIPLSAVSSGLDVALSTGFTPTEPLWHHLTWDQGATLLRYFPIAHLLRLFQIVPERREAIARHLIDTINTLTTQVVDLLAQVPNWSDPQTLVPAEASRSFRESSDRKLDEAIAHLEREYGIAIPPDALCRSTSLDNRMRLYTIGWSLEQSLDQDWALWFVVVSQEGKLLRSGTRLDTGTTRLLDTVTLESDQAFLYGLPLESRFEESLVCAVTPPGELPITLPPLVWTTGVAQ